MVTYVLLEASTHSNLLDLIHFCAEKSLKFTFATELRQLFSCDCMHVDKTRTAAETSSSASDHFETNNDAEKPESISSHPSPSSVPAAVLLEEAISSTSHVKQETREELESWENEPTISSETNPSLIASEAPLEERVTHLENIVQNMETRILNLEHPALAASSKKPLFGNKAVKSSQRYRFNSPGPRFKDLDLVSEYNTWRTFVPQLFLMNEEKKLNSFIKHIFSRVCDL
ncbi:unnamed protein product [Strongylus vulgaris]|uniref:Uncharacterized protein n=1 Tax=Strongylus vulgaris TaxID=40348 RepID=A0A3P7KWL7_STRVU|nr:unnamed protein product [Strongylus vulgaris]